MDFVPLIGDAAITFRATVKVVAPGSEPDTAAKASFIGIYRLMSDSDSKALTAAVLQEMVRRGLTKASTAEGAEAGVMDRVLSAGMKETVAALPDHLLTGEHALLATALVGWERVADPADPSRPWVFSRDALHQVINVLPYRQALAEAYRAAAQGRTYIEKN
jgi:hypothetical protein